ncbi:unnamed protein product [Pseudo-nitzschia multistriata]|uniref:Uncharacterized protein n=1 Tax=Pseudo-nitzschia multistriata TaxID=183589 RepID=A0A448ZDM8_9STRA|nr:unnamed protein product [Pseudo-nitzschia multistriata]
MQRLSNGATFGVIVVGIKEWVAMLVGEIDPLYLALSAEAECKAAIAEAVEAAAAEAVALTRSVKGSSNDGRSGSTASIVGREGTLDGAGVVLTMGSVV